MQLHRLGHAFGEITGHALMKQRSRFGEMTGHDAVKYPNFLILISKYPVISTTIRATAIALGLSTDWPTKRVVERDK